MPRRPRRSSTHVTLVLIGAAAFASACGAPDSPRRAQYATKEDCVADWGDPRECEEQQARDGSGRRIYVGGARSGWGGYGRGGTTGGHAATGTTTRGGFGASGHAHGSGAS
jgi:hypothetical protein